VLFLSICPELVDAAGRALAASYYSGIDTGTEGLVSLGVSRSTSESLGRDLKAMPEAFAGSPTVARRMIPPPPLQLTGQIHHSISKRVFRELENHVNLRGLYKYRDPRFETQAVDLPAHNGYWVGMRTSTMKLKIIFARAESLLRRPSRTICIGVMRNRI
jgi:hypothetical protein